MDVVTRAERIISTYSDVLHMGLHTQFSTYARRKQMMLAA